MIVCFEARIQFTFFTWNDLCTPYCGLAVCMFFSCPSIKARWPSVWFRTYLVVREETMSLLLLQLCQNTMVCLCADCSANWHRLWQNKFREPADSLHSILSWQTLASTAHRHWSQLCEPSGRSYHFLDLVLVSNLPVLLLSKSTFWMLLLYTDKCWSWYFYMILFLPITSPCFT